jgi:hypothetical protein
MPSPASALRSGTSYHDVRSTERRQPMSLWKLLVAFAVGAAFVALPAFA